MTPVGAHDEIGPDGELPVRGFDSHAGHAFPFEDQVADFSLRLQLETSSLPDLAEVSA